MTESFKQQLKEYEKAIKEYLKYDHLTGSIVWKKHRGSAGLGYAAGSIKKSGYIQICILMKDGKQKFIFAHRAAWFLHFGSWPNCFIDHINGNRSDNRIQNLRDVSIRQNQQNTIKHRNGNLLGASSRDGLWQSQIVINKKHISLGRYKTEIEASEMYHLALKNIDKYSGSNSDFRKELLQLLKGER